MPRLKRQPGPEPDPAEPEVVGIPAPIPWSLIDLLRDGPARLEPRPASADFSITLVLPPGAPDPRSAGIPPQLLRRLEKEDVRIDVVLDEDLHEDVAETPPAPPPAPASPGDALRAAAAARDGLSRDSALPPAPREPGVAAPLAPREAGASAPPVTSRQGSDAAVPGVGGDSAPPAAPREVRDSAPPDAAPPDSAPPDSAPRDRADSVAASLTSADVVVAVGWAAAPAVLTASGLRARAVLVTADPPPLAALGWATGVPVLGPRWLGGELPAGVDSAYVPRPVHRRDDLVLIHGEEPFGLLAAAELHRRRSHDLAFAVTGVRPDLALPFPFLGIEPGPDHLAYAFASATVALAPPVRGWRPAATAMLACGQAVVAPDDAPSRAALQDAAAFADGPLAAADAVEHLLADADYTLRSERARAGFALIPGGWDATATALAAALRAL